jgi:hypothetical protein
VKAKQGGYVDKDQHEQRLTELQKTLSVFNPGANMRPPVDERTATAEELLGLDNKERNEGMTVAEELFGKRVLKE